MLVAAFFLPFWNLTTGPSGAFDSLYSSFRFVLSNLASIQNSGLQQEAVLAYVIMLGGAMVIAAGVLGVFPRGSGILAVIAMVGLTLGPFVLYPNYPFDVANYGAGFWAVWVLGLVALIAAGWQGRANKRARGTGTPVTQPGQASAPAPAP